MNKLYWLTDLQLFASKKGVGSSKNGRDSNPKYLGAKLGDGQLLKQVKLFIVKGAIKSTLD